MENAQPAPGPGGTTDYDDLSNKPRINNVVLTGNKDSDDLGLASISDLAAKANASDVYTKTQTDDAIDDALDDALANVYTKTQTDNAIDNAIDDALSDIDTLVENTVDGAITELDVPTTSVTGHYIKSISQTDGLISAVAERLATAPVPASTLPITSDAVYTALSGKVDNSTYAATQIRYEDSGQINLKDLTWTQTSGSSGVWIADAYDVEDIDVIVSVIVTGFGQFRPSDFDMFFTYIPSSVTGMHRVRVVADTNVAQAVVNPYVNLRIFGYGQQSAANRGAKSSEQLPFGVYEDDKEVIDDGNKR